MSIRSSALLMSTRNIILSLLLTFVVWGSVPAFAQYKDSGHYVGSNLRFTEGGWGLGVEFGWTLSRAYLGLEAGINHLLSAVSQYWLPSHGQPADPQLSVEPFVGLHLGYYVLDWLGTGIVATGSTARFWDNGDTVTRKRLDIGIDLRFRTSEHFEFTTALTTRPLLKFGFGYLW
jgi:hypothetical protein